MHVREASHRKGSQIRYAPAQRTQRAASVQEPRQLEDEQQTERKTCNSAKTTVLQCNKEVTTVFFPNSTVT